MSAKQLFFCLFISLFSVSSFSQSESYQQKKATQLAGRSPFQDEIDGKYPERILYEDDYVIAVKSIAPQLPVHLIFFPKKRIPTINDLTGGDEIILAKMILAAKKMAKDLGIAEAGYRLAINTNEDAGQSVFHIHMHLLGGTKTGAMVDQSWRNKNASPSSTYYQDLDNIKSAYADYYRAWMKNDPVAVMKTLDSNAMIIPSGMPPVKGIDAIKSYWFPEDGSITTIEKFEFTIDDLKFDNHSAYITGTSLLSFTYEKSGVSTAKKDQKQVHVTCLQRQEDGQWLITNKIWHGIN